MGSLSNQGGSLSNRPAGGLSVNPGSLSYPNTGTLTTGFSPLDLFLAGDLGFLNDTLPLSSLFTTAAGSTNVTTVGDLTGREESLVTPKNNATQASGGSRPTYGRATRGEITNRMAQTGAQSEGVSGWATTNMTLTGSVTGILSRAAETAATASHAWGLTNGNGAIASGTTYTGFVILKIGSGDAWVQLTCSSQGFDEANQWRMFNISTGALGNAGASLVASDIRATPASLIAQYPELASSYICMIQMLADSTVSSSSMMVLGLTDNTNAVTRLPSYAGDTNANVLFSRAAFVVGARDIDWYLSNYQRVAAAYDITAVSTPSIPALWFDNSNDFMGFGLEEWSANGDYFADTGHAVSDAFAFCTFNKGGTVGISKASATAANRTFQTVIDGASGKLRSYIRGGDTENNTADLADGRWHWIVRIISGGTVTVYVDGTAYTPSVGAAAEEVQNLIFGARTESSLGQPFGGFMVFALSINRALTAAETAQLNAWGRSYFGSP